MNKWSLFLILALLLLVACSGSNRYKYDPGICGDLLKAYNSKDIDATNKIMDCVNELDAQRVAELTQNPLAQECKTENYSDLCILNQAMENEELDLCFLMSPFMAKACITKIAMLKMDDSICKELPSGTWRKEFCPKNVRLCLDKLDDDPCGKDTLVETIFE